MKITASLPSFFSLGFSLVFSLASQAFNIEYVVGVSAFPERRVNVRIVIEGWRDSKIKFMMPTNFGTAEDLSKLISQVDVKTNGKSRKVNLFAASGKVPSVTYEALEIEPGTLEIKYVVSPPDYKEYWKLSSAFNIIQKDHAAIKGMQTFVQIAQLPSDFENIQIRFELPEGWKVFCPSVQVEDNICGIGEEIEASERKEAINNNVYAVGNWERKEAMISGVRLEVLRGGDWEMGFNDFFKAMEAPISWQLKSMGAHNRKHLSMVVDTYPEEIEITGWSGGGESLHDSTYSLVMRNLSKEEFLERALYVAAHEFFHSFDWEFDGGEDNMAWFYEGTTDYMAYKSLLDSGVLSESSVNKVFRFLIEKSYWNQDAVRSVSILDASKSLWEDTSSSLRKVQKEDIIYRKTTLLAMAMDGMALELGSKKTFKDVLSLLWNRHGINNREISLEIIFSTIYEVMGREVKDFFVKNLLSTKELDMGEMLRMRGLNFSVSNSPDLGLHVFDAGGSPKVIDFDSGLSRQQISHLGLKVGDVIKTLNGRVILSAWDLGQRVAQLGQSARVDLEIERNGKTLRVQIPVRNYRKLNFGPTASFRF
ncbi:MAG: hypothetical protein SGJ18_04705 [Pseudomonadota bacterium]|nr:hypothetical protein [Pseudomonadota bacterium]